MAGACQAQSWRTGAADVGRHLRLQGTQSPGFDGGE